VHVPRHLGNPFPLIFLALRDNVTLILGLPSSKRRVFYPMTFFLLALVVLLASVLTDITYISALAGAIAGAVLTLIFPGIMLSLSGRAQGENDEVIGPKERRCGTALTLLGALILCAGTAIVNVENWAPHLLDSR